MYKDVINIKCIAYVQYNDKHIIYMFIYFIMPVQTGVRAPACLYHERFIVTKRIVAYHLSGMYVRPRGASSSQVHIHTNNIFVVVE